MILEQVPLCSGELILYKKHKDVDHFIKTNVLEERLCSYEAQ